MRPEFSKAQIEAAVERAPQTRPSAHGRYGKALDYLEGDIRRHVESALSERSREAQATDQPIEPFAIGMTQKFVEESATSYSGSVTREVINADGSVNDEVSEAYANACDHSEFMRMLEQVVLLVKSCGVYYQIKRGKLTPRFAFPHKVTPILSDNLDADATQLADHDGVVMDLGAKKYLWVGHAEIARMHGDSIKSAKVVGDPYPIEWTWPQPTDAGVMQSAPLMPFAIAKYRETLTTLFSSADPDVADANSEINAQWSSLLDTSRYQSYSVPVIQQALSEITRPLRRLGVRWPLPLKLGETFSFANASVAFDQLTSMITTVTQTLSVMRNQNPNDYALVRSSASSGFAKLLDSLPKLTERERNNARWSRFESSQLWPIHCSMLVHMGELPEAAKEMSLRVTFGEYKIPKSDQEEQARLEFEFKHGLNSPARYLAEKRGITIDEAKALIAENGAQAPQQQAPAERPVSRLSALINGR